MSVLNSEIFWAAVWALTHLAGLVVMLILSRRSWRQLDVAHRWRRSVTTRERRDADDLIVLTHDRHRRNMGLTLAALLYLVLGLLVVSASIHPWLDPDVFTTVARLILTAGEVIWIGSAYLSVTTGDRLMRGTEGRDSMREADLQDHKECP
jgi:hypothetical protein